MTTTTKTPIQKFRHGYVEAAIWENEGQNGTFYTVTFGRNYKDGDKWNTSDSYSTADLVYLQKATEEAYRWIHNIPVSR